MRGKGWSWILAGAALAIAVLVLVVRCEPARTDSTAPDPAVRTDAGDPVAAPTAVGADARVPDSTPPDRTTPEALPAPGTRLLDLLPELEARSRAGDRRASCRLAHDAELCRQAASLALAADYFEGRAAATTDVESGDFDFLVRLEERGRLASRVCEGLPDGWAGSASWRYMLRAGLQGDVTSALRFAAEPPMDPTRFLDQADAWEAYRTHAVDLVRAAWARGDLRAGYLLQKAHAGYPVFRGGLGLGAPDAGESVRLAMLLRDLVDDATRAELDAHLDALRPAIPASEWMRIQRLADGERIDRGLRPASIHAERGLFADSEAADCERE